MQAIKVYCAVLMLLLPCRAHGAEDSLRVGAFGTVRLYYESPHPANVVLFISGDGGWNLGVVDMARSLASLDAVVAGIDIVRYLRALQGSHQDCLYPAGDLENLSKAVQQHLNLDEYRVPVLVGYSSGATLAYAALAQSPSNTFKGAISLGFCPDLPLTRPMCRGDGLDWRAAPDGKGYVFLPCATLQVPWVALQGEIDRVCSPDETKAFVSRVKNGTIVMLPKVGHGFSVPKNWMPQFTSAFAGMAARLPSAEDAAAEVPDLHDLPLVEIPGARPASDVLAIVLSGDGGWGETEKGIARDLARSGAGVVGWNSLRYYWKSRTPDGAAADLERIARHYLSSWKEKRLVLIGYSFGADVLPFLASRLSDDVRGVVKTIALVGPSRYAEFQFHISDWLGRAPSPSIYRTGPELEKLRGTNIRIFCFAGESDSDAICSELDTTLATSIVLRGGHRVRGNFEPIGSVILESIR
jgi:type IV secretory pathway VirJ component